MDAVILASLYSVSRQQLHADANCAGPSGDKCCRVLLVYASRGDEFHLRQRNLQRSDIHIPTDWRGRIDFYELRARLPCCNHFGGRERAGDGNNASLESRLDNIRHEASAGEKLGSSVKTALRGFLVENGIGADNHFREL